jgi:hypothetical protein
VIGIGVSRFATLSAVVLFVILATSVSHAHVGRRIQVGVENGKLIGQGANSNPSAPDFGVRSYPGAVHDHWQANPLDPNAAFAFAPEFDILSPVAGLQDYPLYLRWESTQKWVAPPMMPMPDTVPVLQSLSAGELIAIEATGSTMANSDMLGDLLLHASVPAAGKSDIGLLYALNRSPAGSLYVLEFTLHSGSPHIAPSDSIYLVMSPYMTAPGGSLHHAAIFLEEYLGTRSVVPEPSGVIVAFLLVTALVAIKRPHLTPINMKDLGR